MVGRKHVHISPFAVPQELTGKLDNSTTVTGQIPEPVGWNSSLNERPHPLLGHDSLLSDEQ